MEEEPAMSTPADIARHYTSGDLLARLAAKLQEDGVDPARPTFDALTPYDQFHGRGIDATEDLARDLEVAPTDHILDVGSGIGGPARYLARRFGCRVRGIDLTAEFCEVARHLTAQLGLTERIAFEQGDALAMPFGDAAFDGAYTMNVSMNIADKRGFFTEIHRVLKPGAWFRLSEIAQGPGGAPDYPTPWARTASSSFLATPAETCANLEASGFAIESQRDTAEAALAYAARSRAVVEAGGQPPHRAVSLVHGALAEEAIANAGRALQEGRTVPIELICRKVSESDG
ncbi:MAG: methyltransferase domain-containing protein [Rhodospirillales bacterium]|nr:methyltransferase domain-containing protein [Rhodospirillales bacterium]